MQKHFITVTGIIVALGVVSAISVYYLRNTPLRVLHRIELTETGFSSQNISVAKGDTIIFITTRRQAFWPASDLHPTHGAYPEFDPKKPIPAGESWSFKFDKVGRWKYHDHLSPVHTGTIIVIDSTKTTRKGTSRACDGSKDENRTQCWRDAVAEALKDNGLAAAFDVLADFYVASPAFAADCHGFTHDLGKIAYEKFSRDEDLTLTPKTSYCGYGFYHGFMETLLLTSGDIKKAQKFCEYVDAQLSHVRSGASTACYHGIGHGTIDGGDPRTWGNAEEMMRPGIAMCQQVAETEFQEYLCATGVFNSIEVLSRDPKYGITALGDNPFRLCYNQPQSYREPCYTNMLPLVLNRARGDFSKAAEYIEKNIQHANDPTINGFTIREMVILSLFHEFMRENVHTSDYAERGIALCRALPEHSRLACVEGLADGHMKYGKPGAEYIKVFSFCADNRLREDERTICYKHILARLPIWYAKDERAYICKSVPRTYQTYCAP